MTYEPDAKLIRRFATAHGTCVMWLQNSDGSYFTNVYCCCYDDVNLRGRVPRNRAIKTAFKRWAKRRGA